MENESFDRFMHQIGATISTDIESYFKLYKFGQLYFHFIDVKSSQLNNINPDYFICMNKNSTNKVIHVWEDLWINHLDIIENRIIGLIGKNKRIHARQTHLERVNKLQANAFLTANHLQGPTNAYYKFALKFQNEIVALMTISKSRVMHDGPNYYRSYELERFASKKGYTITGGLSKLLHYFIDQFQPAHIMTYADADWGTGEGYKKLGFTETETTAPQSFLVHPNEMIRMPETKLNAQKISEMKANGYITIYNSGSIKFILDLRNQIS